MSSKEKELLLGNEAVVRGALEAGVAFASTYPGTPASEIGDTFASICADLNDLYFEYSSNEKVALESAAGAAFSGVKALVAMKHYGVNVASDSLLPLAYLECPLVVAVSDDPGCWSSVQTEQDTRWYSRMGKIPILEPSNPQEVKEMTKLAFKIAWEYKIPVIVRLTTRVSHVRAPVAFDNLPERKALGKFEKPKDGFPVSSANTLALKQKLMMKVKKLRREAASLTSEVSADLTSEVSPAAGVIASGVSFDYFQEALQELDQEVPWFKVGMSYPFPAEIIADFIKDKTRILVLEELDPIVEIEVRELAKDVNPDLEIHGKDWLTEVGEYKPEIVRDALINLVGADKLAKDKNQVLKALPEHGSEEPALPAGRLSKLVTNKIPTLCAGCPHRSTFWAVKEALGEDKIAGGDIGCYMLGALEPYKNQDFIVAMGAGMGISHGISKATGEKPLVFIGDSTFFHAGIPALINMVFNQSDVLVIILDNRMTAMTGHQPHPGTGERPESEGECKEVLIEDIARAAGADAVGVANVYNFSETVEKVKDLYGQEGVSVLVAKGECRLVTVRKLARAGKEIPSFELAEKITEKDKEDLKDFGCPAIREKDGELKIDEDQCWGCAYCKQLAPNSVKPSKD